jgi:hypothetical protein
MKNFILTTFFAFISLLIISNVNAADPGNRGVVNLTLEGTDSSFIFAAEKLPYFKTLQSYVNTDMHKAINPVTGHFNFSISKSQEFDSEAFDRSIKILFGLCDIDLKRTPTLNPVERINNCMEYFNQKKKDYLAETLLTAYVLGDFLGADLIIQRAIINRVYDKIFTTTEAFDYESFEKYLINPEDFDEEVRSRADPYLINLSHKNLRSANLSYLLEKLKPLNDFRKLFHINLSHNKIRNKYIRDLETFKNSNFNIELNIEDNPLLDETKQNIRTFKKHEDPTINEKLEQVFNLEIRYSKKRNFAALGTMSLFASLAINQLLKRISFFIALAPSKTLQTGIRLGAYLLPLSGLAYLHYQWFKNDKKKALTRLRGLESLGQKLKIRTSFQ